MKTKIIALSASAILIIGIIGFFVLRTADFIEGNGNAQWEEARAYVYPQLMPVYIRKQEPLLHRDFIRELDIGYVVMATQQYQFLDPSFLKKWNVSLDTIHNTAMANLDRLAEEDTEYAIRDAGENAVYGNVNADDPLMAARILSPVARKRIIEELKSPEFYAAFPVRDGLIFWGKHFKYHDQFLNQTKQQFDAELEKKYQFTTRAFLVDLNGIKEPAQPLGQPAAAPQGDVSAEFVTQ